MTDQKPPTYVTLTTIGSGISSSRPKEWSYQTRTVGVFASLDTATAVLEQRLGDLNEAGWYPYAVLEELPYGLYPNPRRFDYTIRWYEFDFNTKTWGLLAWPPVWTQGWQSPLLTWANIG